MADEKEGLVEKIREAKKGLAEHRFEIFSGLNILDDVCTLAETMQQAGEHKKAFHVMGLPLEMVYQYGEMDYCRTFGMSTPAERFNKTKDRVVKLGIDLALHLGDLEQVLEIYERGADKYRLTQQDCTLVYRIAVEELKQPERAIGMFKDHRSMWAARILAETGQHQEAAELYKDKRYVLNREEVEFFAEFFRDKIDDLEMVVDVYLHQQDKKGYNDAAKICETELGDSVRAAVIYHQAKNFGEYRRILTGFQTQKDYDAEFKVYMMTEEYDLGLNWALEVGSLERAQEFKQMKEKALAAKERQRRPTQTLAEAQGLRWRLYRQTPCG